MKKLILLSILFISLASNSFAKGQTLLECSALLDTPSVNICAMPNTNVVNTGDYLIKERHDCSVTENIKVADFIASLGIVDSAAVVDSIRLKPGTDTVQMRINTVWKNAFRIIKKGTGSQVMYFSTATGKDTSDANFTNTKYKTFIRHTGNVSGYGQAYIDTIGLFAYSLSSDGLDQVFFTIDPQITQLIYQGDVNTNAGIAIDNNDFRILNYGTVWSWPHSDAAGALTSDGAGSAMTFVPTYSKTQTDSAIAANTGGGGTVTWPDTSSRNIDTKFARDSAIIACHAKLKADTVAACSPLALTSSDSINFIVNDTSIGKLTKGRIIDFSPDSTVGIHIYGFRANSTIATHKIYGGMTMFRAFGLPLTYIGVASTDSVKGLGMRISSTPYASAVGIGEVNEGSNLRYSVTVGYASGTNAETSDAIFMGNTLNSSGGFQFYGANSIGSSGTELGVIYDALNSKTFISTNVGIGVVSPSKKLDVNGSINVTDTIFCDHVQAHSPLTLNADSITTNHLISTPALRVSGLSTPNGKVATYDSNGNITATSANALSPAVLDTLIDLLTGTVTLTNNAVNIIVASSTITATTIAFPTGTTNDEITIIFSKAITTPTLSGAGTNTISLPTIALGNRLVFKNYQGRWY